MTATAADAEPVQGTSETLAHKFKRLSETDGQFRSAFPSQAVTHAKRASGLRLTEVVKVVMEGYAPRPALGRRARVISVDPASGRRTQRLLPRFETISYGELWTRSRAIAAAWREGGEEALKPGDFICILGFTSPDYVHLILASLNLGVVIVPLQFGASASQHARVMQETKPRILATSLEALDTAVEAILSGSPADRLVVFDYEPEDDNHRERLARARTALAGTAHPMALDTIDEVAARGSGLPLVPLFKAPPGEDPVTWLFYTSGATGAPKGAIFTESLVTPTWTSHVPLPMITVSFLPMSHLIGNSYVLRTLANGGTTYFSAKSDLSTLLDDLRLVRPTMTSLVPRICELFYQHALVEVDRRVTHGEIQQDAEDSVKLWMRNQILGGRLLSVNSGSASLAPEIYNWVESMLGFHMPINYSSTEIGGGLVLVDGRVQRPPVLAYRLKDVPELGYLSTDKPYPRGELLVKSDRNMRGYYNQPALTASHYDEDGFYHTGDVMAELGPDHLVFVDRRNTVIKLQQGEFIAISKLEALYSTSPAIKQIYIYGSSERSFLVAVVVPSDSLIGGDEPTDAKVEAVKAAVRRSLQQIAQTEGLNRYEIPRNFLIEMEPFTVANGLLTAVGKHQRPALKARYDRRLIGLYAQMVQDQRDELRALRSSANDRSVIETVVGALKATLGLSVNDVHLGSRFSELGGDSLSALTFSMLLEEIYGIEVPVGVIINPAADVRQLARYIEEDLGAAAKRPRFGSIHGRSVNKVYARELTLDRFIPASVIVGAKALPPPTNPIRTVLLTGATGFLGRFQALIWLERMAQTGGKLICLVRGDDPDQARSRLEGNLKSDPNLLAHFRALAESRLEVLAGDIGLANLGLKEADWARLASTVDLIVHSAAHVNHLLPYRQLFAANVLGTAELIRLAITNRLKRFNFISTLAVSALGDRLVDEDGDLRQTIPAAPLNDQYANGYRISKWAGEVLLREAHERCGVPVSVFRSGMILAHSRYTGQLNVPDMFSRLLLSLATTGVAPGTFYAETLRDGRPRARYDGFAVDVLAEAITVIGACAEDGFHSYNVASSGEHARSLDDVVDIMIAEGCAIERIGSYREWLSRFETAMRGLPEAQRQRSLATLLAPYRHPQQAGTRPLLRSERFEKASKAAGLALSPLPLPIIAKYVSDFRDLKLI